MTHAHKSTPNYFKLGARTITHYKDCVYEAEEKKKTTLT